MFEVYTGKDVQNLKSVNEWCIFKKLKDLRNGITHPKDPFSVYEITKLPEYLNYIRIGIGGLLSLFFFHAGEEPLLFVKKLQYARIVEYNER